MVGTILLVLLILLLIGALPRWDLHRYGYAPSTAVMVIVIILVIFILKGRI